MFNEFQVNQVWEEMISAETRSLYFQDLAARYTRRKQLITGASFFLASGAAATVIGKMPDWVPASLSLIVAVLTAYSIAVNLDGRIKTMCSLHATWNSIVTEYQCLWAHTTAEDAEERLYRVVEKEREASEIAVSSAPNDQKLMEKWEDQVFALHHLKQQHG